MIKKSENWAHRMAHKTRVFGYALDGTFDQRDKQRLKPLTRLRKTKSDIKKEREGDRNLRVKDWYDDIDGGR